VYAKLIACGLTRYLRPYAILAALRFELSRQAPGIRPG